MNTALLCLTPAQAGRALLTLSPCRTCGKRDVDASGEGAYCDCTPRGSSPFYSFTWRYVTRRTRLMRALHSVIIRHKRRALRVPRFVSIVG